MINWVLKKFGGDFNKKELQKIYPIVDKIKEYDADFDSLSDEQVQNKTEEFKERYNNGETLDDLLPEAFAVVKQACKRLYGTEFEVKGYKTTWDMIPFDVQLVGGIVLHQGRISEMKTGEGKTLVATLPIYLNAITGNGVHVVTVNDYLAQRDCEWMGVLYHWLNLQVGAITKEVGLDQRRDEYAKDVIYVENSELGFDYLRDNLAKSLNERVLLWRPLNFAIVDEVDSVLIDEARTPLIISRPSEELTDKYVYYQKIVQQLYPCKGEKKKPKSFVAEMLSNETEEDKQKEKEEELDYYIDEKLKTITLTSNGIQKLENIIGVENLYRDLGYDEIHHIENALRAKSVFYKDKDYLVKDFQVILVDQQTGRTMPGRRFSEGLHQALEAKEGVPIQKEAQTVASITYQNFFKQYQKLSGMTGTAVTEGEEFERIYNLDVIEVPTHKDVIRADQSDKVYFNQDTKWSFVLENIKFYHNIGVPILIGTSSIDTSEHLSDLLKKSNLKHSVLNAKFHEQEANIIQEAGTLGSIVVATNMAGRGTDIKLEKGLHDNLSINYAKWIYKIINGDDFTNTKPQNLQAVVYSKYEYFLTLKGIKEHFSLDDMEVSDFENISSINYNGENIKISTSLNNSKKTKDEVYGTIYIENPKLQKEDKILRYIHYGLLILGTEKHESRRIDNQLRGRSGRQGDPGFSQFFVALDDEIMRKMGGSRIQSVAKMMLPTEQLEKMELTQKQFTTSIERAQKQMEGWHFSMRKQLFDYDSVINKQRQRIYSKRDQILFSDETIDEETKKKFNFQGEENFDVIEEIRSFIRETIEKLIPTYTNVYPWDVTELTTSLEQITGIHFEEKYIRSFKTEQDLIEYLISTISNNFEEKLREIDNNKLAYILKIFYLEVIDTNWITHIDEMQYLREKVSLYGYAQMDPLIMYKKEAYEKFQRLMFNIKKNLLSYALKTDFTQYDVNQPQSNIQSSNNYNFIDSLRNQGEDVDLDSKEKGSKLIDADKGEDDYNVQISRGGKTRPNDPCPCGSGKKYKKCCGK